MTGLALTLALLSLLTLLSLVLSATVFCQLRVAGKSNGVPDENPLVNGMRTDLDGLAAQLHDMQQQPAPAAVATLPRPGLNLAKRSQALRLHRHGSTASQIASALELPVQEVELLLKVQRIVLSNIQAS